MSDNNGVTPEKLTRVYVKMRDKKAKLAAEFKKVDDDLKAQMEKIKEALLQHCKENGVEGGRTLAGTFSRSVKTKYWTSDWDEMNKFIMEHDLPEFYTKSLNQTNVRDYLKENPDVIPKGLNVDSEYVISIRKPTKKQESNDE